MMVQETERDLKCLQSSPGHLQHSLSAQGSVLGKSVEDALSSAHNIMAQMLSRALQEPIYYLSSLDPGIGKTGALCAFLRAWKADGFAPAHGALVVLSTRQEITACIDRSGLLPCDYAVMVQKGHELNERGAALPELAPVIFTTQEKLRRLCAGQTFAEIACLHYRGKPRRLRVWDEAFMPSSPVVSRSTLEQPAARQEVLEAAANVINDSGEGEPWLIIHAKDRPAASSIVQELSALVANPSRLSFIHWGNHHGTNDYRDIRRVMVLGLWNQPGPAYSALHIAAGGEMSLATDKATLSAIQAGEHRHNILQAVCRASVRNGADGVCGNCEVYLVGKLPKDTHPQCGTGGLLHETFPGAAVTEGSSHERIRHRPLSRTIQPASQRNQVYRAGWLSED